MQRANIPAKLIFGFQIKRVSRATTTYVPGGGAVEWRSGGRVSAEYSMNACWWFKYNICSLLQKHGRVIYSRSLPLNLSSIFCLQLSLCGFEIPISGPTSTVDIVITVLVGRAARIGSTCMSSMLVRPQRKPMRGLYVVLRSGGGYHCLSQAVQNGQVI